MIGVEYVPPTAPRLLIVKVLPRRSSSLKLLFRALSAIVARAARMSGILSSSAPAQGGHDQAAFGIDGDADVDVLLVDDLLVDLVERRVDRRIVPQRHRDRLDHERHRGELDPRDA